MRNVLLLDIWWLQHFISFPSRGGWFYDQHLAKCSQMLVELADVTVPTERHLATRGAPKLYLDTSTGRREKNTSNMLCGGLIEEYNINQSSSVLVARFFSTLGFTPPLSSSPFLSLS